MKRIIARIYIKDEHIDAFRKIGAQMVEKTSKEKGCLFYRLFEDISRPGEFIFYEEYKDQADVDFHMSSPHFKEFVQASGPMHLKKSVVEII